MIACTRFGGWVLGGLLLAVGSLCAQQDSSSLGSSIGNADFDSLVIEKHIFSSQSGFWRMNADAFEKAYAKYGFVWVSEDRRAARAATKHMSFVKKPVLETLVRFVKGYPTEVVLSLYNKGDGAQLIGKTGFQKEIAEVQKVLSQILKTQPQALEKNATTMGTRRGGNVWKNRVYTFTLDWAYSTKDKDGRLGFTAEYIRLSAGPTRRIQAAAASTKPRTLKELKQSVESSSEGDVVINSVPMVDQGEKGYCGVAAAARIFQYYNLPVDQHDLAQMTGTDAETGTSPDKMVEALKKAGVKLGCKLFVLEDWDSKDFVRMIKDYNKAAKKAGKKEVPIGDYQMTMNQVYEMMDAEVLRAVRTKSKTGLSGFERNIKKYVSAGIPIAWACMLGVVPEATGAQIEVEGLGIIDLVGGHMRVIIGYNENTGEVIYTDSWGKGHESKRMGIEDAWTITTGLYAITPRS